MVRGYLSSTELAMPSLRGMHVIVAKDPRAHAKFALFMNELRYRFIIGAERVHIGRTTRVRPSTQVHDQVAASL